MPNVSLCAPKAISKSCLGHSKLCTDGLKGFHAHIVAPLVLQVNSAACGFFNSAGNDSGMDKDHRKAKMTPARLEDAKRLKQLWAVYKTTPDYLGQERFGGVYGIGSQSAVTQFINGHTPLSPKAAAAFARGLGCSIRDISPELSAVADHFIVGTGEGSENNSDVRIGATSENSSNIPDSIVIKQYDSGGKMGSGLILKDQPGVIKSWTVNEEWVRRNVRNVTSISNLAIVTGFGDSMQPMYNPGDPLLVDRGITTVEFDGVYFFRVGEEGFIKRLQRIPGQGILVISDNNKYRDWTIAANSDFEVFAKVVTAWRSEQL